MEVTNVRTRRHARRDVGRDLLYWGVFIPGMVIWTAACWVAEIIRDTWPVWIAVVGGFIALYGTAMIVSGATSAEQRLFGAMMVSFGTMVAALVVSVATE